jgi:predicted transcriptional regulator
MTRDRPSAKADMEALLKDVEQNPDHYQYERAKKFGVAQSAVFYALKRLETGDKKNAVSSQGR